MARMRRLVDSLLEVSRRNRVRRPWPWPRWTWPSYPPAWPAARQPWLSTGSASAWTSPRPAPAPADRDKIERVIANLLDNAIKYSPRHGVIGLTGRCEGRWITLTVSDQGRHPEERQRIFERFAQVGGGRRGFGLGLSYCRLAVEKHGGEVWVEDGDDGRGSKFVVRLPAVA